MTYGVQKSEQTEFSLSRARQRGIPSDVREMCSYVNEGNAQGSKRSSRRDRNRNKSNPHTYKSINYPFLSQVEILAISLSQDRRIKKKFQILISPSAKK